MEGAIEKKRLPHGLLFLGPANAGQRKTALELTKAVFCENKNGWESCGACAHCKQVDQESHPDLVILEPEEDSRVIKIEEIRDLIARANLKPFSANAKVFMIARAECMNEAAQNALLKTLEEPAGKAHFILISSNPEGLLATIRSRLQTLYFLPVRPEEALDPAEEELKRQILEYVRGGAERGTRPPDFAKAEREAIGRIFDGVIEFLRDALLLRAGAEEFLFSSGGRLQKEELARRWDEEALGSRIELFAEFKEKITEGNINLKIALAVLWDKLSD